MPFEKRDFAQTPCLIADFGDRVVGNDKTTQVESIQWTAIKSRKFQLSLVYMLFVCSELAKVHGGVPKDAPCIIRYSG